MSTSQNLWFLVFVIRIVAEAMFDDDQAKAYAELKGSGALQHFADHYDILHTQGDDYLLTVAKSYLKAA
ncbi:MAG: DUF3791 domain-containing protein [Coriobacteriales bacterium]|jgi:hypothetical protein|nr:DUF3791 domain-containing protein [Coriobacteriales bacterium]